MNLSFLPANAKPAGISRKAERRALNKIDRTMGLRCLRFRIKSNARKVMAQTYTWSPP
jgi:hypothetical protein